MYIYTHICIYTYTYIDTYTSYTYTYIYIYIYIYIIHKLRPLKRGEEGVGGGGQEVEAKIRLYRMQGGGVGRPIVIFLLKKTVFAP